MKTDNLSIYVAGHRGMVGSAIVDHLKESGYRRLITAGSDELDLRDQRAVGAFMADKRPDVVIVAAARVGGILANSEYPWQFLYDNLMIEANLINAAHQNDVDRLIFLGSSCIYPKHAPQPLREEYLLTGPLEPTNEWYAVAKITGIKLCQALNRQYGRRYISLMPTNLYGPRDNFDLKTSHVLPAMIRKFHEAKENGHQPVPLWGSGSPKREFLHVNDLAAGVRFVMEQTSETAVADIDAESASGRSPEFASGRSPESAGGKTIHDLINVGTGEDLSIRELAEIIQQETGHRGKIDWDSSKPDGTPRKLMDVGRINAMGWQASIPLREGIRDTYRWFLGNLDRIREVEVK